MTEAKTNTKNNTDEIMVSVFCTCYNHEKYIRDCLDGFIMQETNFKFEVLVHDDASTDNSANIIREYETKYPDIIKPTYQTENQYSQGIHISTEILLPKAKGKYIAFCEGDDFWTDNNKLQKQYNALNSFKKCNLCIHRVDKIIHDTKEHINYIPNKLSSSQVIEKGMLIKYRCNENQIFHISSFFLTKNSYIEFIIKRKKYFNIVGMGDYSLILFYGYYGNAYYLSDIMSCYRMGVPGSWSQTNNKFQNLNINNIKTSIKSMEMLKTLLDGNYDDEIDNGIENKLKIHLAQAYLWYIISNDNKFKNFKTYNNYIQILSKRNVLNNIVLIYWIKIKTFLGKYIKK